MNHPIKTALLSTLVAASLCAFVCAAHAQDVAPDATIHHDQTICRAWPSPQLLTENLDLKPRKVAAACKIVTFGTYLFSFCPRYSPAQPGDEQLSDLYACSLTAADWIVAH